MRVQCRDGRLAVVSVKSSVWSILMLVLFHLSHPFWDDGIHPQAFAAQRPRNWLT